MTLTNSGTTSVTISAITPNGSGISVSGLTLPATVAAGQSVSLTVSFSPTSTGWVGSEVTVTSTASNSNLQIGFHANGVSIDPMTAAPSSLSFGSVSVGSSSALSVSLTNTGSGIETLTAFQTTGSGFSVSGPSLPLVLNKGQSTTLTVTFAPPSSGTLTGSIFVPGPGLSIPLTGTGASGSGQLTVAPASMSFGNVDIGSSTTQASTITADRRQRHHLLCIQQQFTVLALRSLAAHDSEFGSECINQYRIRADDQRSSVRNANLHYIHQHEEY